MQKLRIIAVAPSDMAFERTKIETIASRFRPLAEILNIVLEIIIGEQLSLIWEGLSKSFLTSLSQHHGTC
jgi:hypothetical protein